MMAGILVNLRNYGRKGINHRWDWGQMGMNLHSS